MDGGIRIKSNDGAAGYGVLFRNDNNNFYILFTAQNNANGTWSGTFPFIINFASRQVNFNCTTQSTSTTTGAIVTPGGVGVGGALFAQSLSGLLQLNRYTTATAPVASAGAIGTIFFDTTLGKIRVITSATTIETITSA